MYLDPVRRELVLKIVYYGPGLAGKTTNLKAIRAAAGEHATDLVSVEAHSERTLHCDWLNLSVGPIQGTNVRFALWTVPGQSYYAATRRAVLVGADGVVFVADSRREALDENIDSMNEMLSNLRHHGLPEDIPVVMQFNKQDLPTAVKREQLEPLMNVRGWPSFAAVANGGTGVTETASLICQLVAERVATEPLPSTGLEQPQARDSGSFLISCHRCQTMLEVPSANPGEIYSCGVCNSTIEVVDGDHGVTRQPTGMPAAPDQSPRGVQALADDYAADQVAAYTPAGGNVALQPQATSTSTSTSTSSSPASESPFEIPGYTIVTTLDQTAQGRRYQVREVASGRTFRALSLSADLLRQPGYRDGLEPYVRLAGPIRHPNLLPLATMRTHGENVVFLSQDPADHEPLSYVLARRRALAPPHAMGLLRQMVLALEEGARHGAVHGWLRPDCILVGGDGNVLIDELCVPVHHRFLVKELAGASAATEYYLAPEHLQDDARSDIRSDMFVLGALLFRMMTGEGLVTGYNAHEALHKVNANGPRLLRDAAQGISRELNIFYQKLVAADRRERFQSYRELVEALDRFGGGAKRQNMQLTAPQGRAAVTRSGARNQGLPGTRRTSSASNLSGMASRGRATSTPSNGVAPARRRPERDSGLGVVIVVVIVLVAGVAGFIAIQSSKAPVQPVNDERGNPPSNAFPKPVAPAPIPAPRPEGPRPPPTSAATGGGATPSPTQVVTPAPAPVVSDAPETSTAADRLTALRAIADLLVQERFGEAMVAAARLDDAQRVAKEADIEAMHRERKVAISALIEAGRPIETIREALAPALTVWGMPGDDEWARAQIARAVQRLPEQQTATAVAKTDPVNALTQTPVVLDPAANALLLLQQALAANQPALAAQAVDAVPSANPEGKALRRMADLWAARIALVTRAVGPRKVKLRLPHPTTNEQWDVGGADNQGVAITAPNGSSTNLAWSQVPAKQQGKLFFEAASAAGTNPDENVIASVMQLVADEPGPAQLLARKAKGAAPAEVMADLDLLISLHARRSLISAIQRGQEGARANNLKQVSEALNDIRRFDKEAQAPFTTAIAELETLSSSTTTSKPGEDPAAKGGAVGLKERQNAVRALGWEPVGGAYLDPSGIIFTTAANGLASGLTRNFPANTEGITLAIKGKGQLLVLPGKAGQKTAGGITIPLPTEVARYTIRFLGGILTITEGGNVLQSAQLAAQPTAVTLMVIGEGLMPNAPTAVGAQP